MKERPILFSGPMVRALLAGTKTQTRRVVKGFALEWLTMQNGFNAKFVALPENHPCPYGQSGDRLWVREAWAHSLNAASANFVEDGPFVYAADGELAARERLNPRWVPGIHMFRWASRITLEVTGVRVERLQDISEADAAAEGWTKQDLRSDDPQVHRDAARDWYADLWESINGPGSWDANPWVWCISFQRVPTTSQTNA